ncbi:MAG: hypothetical protein EAZ61_13810, partial [Oscillatoriales cyanobacterium]
MPHLFRRDRNLFLRFPTMALSPATTVTTADASTPILPILMAPARVLRGSGLIAAASPELARLGSRPLIICGDRT